MERLAVLLEVSADGNSQDAALGWPFLGGAVRLLNLYGRGDRDQPIRMQRLAPVGECLKTGRRRAEHGHSEQVVENRRQFCRDRICLVGDRLMRGEARRRNQARDDSELLAGLLDGMHAGLLRRAADDAGRLFGELGIGVL